MDSLTTREANRRTRRRERFSRRRVLWSLSQNRRRAGCGRWQTGSGDGGVGVVLNGDTAHYRGLQTCGSIWSCPVCAAKIRQTRAEEINTAATSWLNGGGGLVFVTFTVPHARGDGLAPLLDAVLLSWQRGVISGGAWKGQWRKRRGREWWEEGDRGRYGIAGFVRSVEVTYGEANGWHPHIHALLFTETVLDETAVAALGERLYSRWAKAAPRYGVGLPERAAFHIAAATSAEVARYVAKVQEGGEPGAVGRGVGLELARSDLKSGRRSGRFLPFELLDHLEDTGETWAAARWHEYEAATAGRRAITWSNGFRARHGLDEDLTDEQIAAADVGGDVLVVLDADAWRMVTRTRGGPVELLEAAEANGRRGVLAALQRLRAGPLRQTG